MLDKTAKLKYQHRSHSNPKIIYGNAGDTVTIISIREHVAIVQANDGNRYPIGLQQLEFDTSVAIEPEVIEVIQPVQELKKKVTKKAQQTQQSLF